MTMHEKLWDALDEVLLALSAEPGLVEKAHREFETQVAQYFGQIDPTVFNDWLVHHYADSRIMASLHMTLDPVLLEAIERAQLSVYSVFNHKQYIIFQDIFTKRQFHVHQDDFEGVVDDQALYLTRIYEVRGLFLTSLHYHQIPKSAQSVLIKEVMEQYQKVKDSGVYTTEGFLRQTPLLLYWAQKTFNDIAAEVPEEEFAVYEVVCTIENKDLFEGFKASKDVQESSFEDVFTLSQEDFADIDFVVEGTRVTFECPRESDADHLREAIEEQGWGLIVLSVNQISLDDLVEND